MSRYSYFDTHRDKIRYDTFIKDGHPIGSGAIESAHKYTVQTRLKQAGMRWNIENANGVVQLRSTYLSGDWDNLWQKAAWSQNCVTPIKFFNKSA